MALIKCDYCETEYESDMPSCPLCGTPNPDFMPEEEEYYEDPPPRRRAGAREAPREEGIPRWLSILICVVLSLAVVIGAIYAMYALDIIKIGKKAEPAPPPVLDLPIDEKDKPAKDEDKPEEAEPAAASRPGREETDEEPGVVVCTGLRVQPAFLNFDAVGMSAPLEAQIAPADCTEAVTWVSSNPEVCSVDASGVVTSLSDGEAIITVACGSETSTVEVICDFGGPPAAPINNAKISMEDVTLLSPGEKVTLKIENPPAEAEISWKSKDESVCIVKDGEVTALSRGETKVVATVNEKELSCTIRCRFQGVYTPPPGTVENPSGSGNKLDHDDVTLKIGESFEISVVNGRSGGWNVTDASIISVNGNGIVKGLAKGTAEVFTVVGGERLACVVRVKG